MSGDAPGELAAVAKWLVGYSIEAAQISNSVPGTDALRALCGKLNIPCIE